MFISIATFFLGAICLGMWAARAFSRSSRLEVFCQAMEYSGITRIDLLLDRYIAVAREARAPLLPAVLEIQKSLPRLASDYAKLVEFEQKTQSDLKKHAYKEKIEAIVRQVRETVTFLHKELHQLEMVNAPELYGDVLTKTDSLIGTDAFAERLERARQEAQALGELNAGQ